MVWHATSWSYELSPAHNEHSSSLQASSLCVEHLFVHSANWTSWAIARARSAKRSFLACGTFLQLSTRCPSKTGYNKWLKLSPGALLSHCRAIQISGSNSETEMFFVFSELSINSGVHFLIILFSPVVLQYNCNYGHGTLVLCTS